MLVPWTVFAAPCTTAPFSAFQEAVKIFVHYGLLRGFNL